MGHPTNEYLDHFVAARNNKDSADLEEFNLVILRISANRFCLLLDVGGTCCRLACLAVAPLVSSFRSALNYCLLRA